MSLKRRAPRNAGKCLRTLVVDDSPPALEAICRLLQLQEEIEVVGVATDGRQALDQIETLHPDLVLMDIQMPEMNGLEAMRQLRQRRSTARVIMISIQDTAEMELICKENGADGFVTKNHLAQKLPAEIRRVFGR